MTHPPNPLASPRRTRRSGPASPSRPGQRRCAVYTRKSSEEGLEQDYNSLHAQREACEAYIRSQQHEGWVLVPTPYDDGGISGGTMNRPALQALLGGVRAGRVDIIVVYKVDRLTRSLADFAKMVELFDATGASFVAVTQQFNTTTSMGRLTLNVLLSFAQFEREVTGERIRDKIAASKRKGLWMGGRTPLGYAVHDRKLVVEPEDAGTVVHLYHRYLALGCVRALKAELDGQGILSKQRTYAGGQQAGGTPYSRGALYALLSNPVYLGQVRHKGECHPGQHPAIVPAALFAAVQARLAAGHNGGRGGEGAGTKDRTRHRVEPSLLAGKLFDAAGERLVPTHARKGERRYRYYVSASLLTPGTGNAARPESNGHQGWRLPALEIEQGVVAALQTVLSDRALLVPDALAAGMPADAMPMLLHKLATLQPAKDGRDARPDAPATADSLALLRRVDLSADGLTLTIALPEASTGQAEQQAGLEQGLLLHRFVPHRVRRRGVEMRLVIETAATPSRSDPVLVKALARAHCWFDDLVQGRAASALEIAHRLGTTPRYVQRLLPLALLAPRLIEDIVAGQHDPSVTAEMLTDIGVLPLFWDDQVTQLRG